MDNLALLRQQGVDGMRFRQRVVQARGAYFTPEEIGRGLARKILEHVDVSMSTLRVIDPFGGDGRLVEWLLAEAAIMGFSPKWEVTVWEVDPETADLAVSQLSSSRWLPASAVLDVVSCDSFATPLDSLHAFDIVITNPPWETVKPDRRTLADLPEDARAEYVERLREVDRRLALRFPDAQPSRKFAGWGTNLSRPGLALSVELLAPGGVVGIVLPSSTFADTLHSRLREWLIRRIDIEEINSFPAEAKHFQGMDVPFVTMVGKSTSSAEPDGGFRLVIHSATRSSSESVVDLTRHEFQGGEWSLPLTPAAMPLEIASKLTYHPRLQDLLDDGVYWAGRELDETGIKGKFSTSGSVPFLKGRDISRLTANPTVSGYLDEEEAVQVRTRNRPRLVWRDVTRPSQIRRVQGTLIKAGPVTGNSLGVAVSQSDSRDDLLWLLGVMSSLVFESQLRTVLSTGHVTLASLRKVHVPALRGSSRIPRLVESILMSPSEEKQADLEGEVALEYGLNATDLVLLLERHPWLDSGLHDRALSRLQRRL